MSREFYIPNKILTGNGALEGSAPYIKQMGKKPLLVSGPNTSKAPCFDELKKLLDKLEMSYGIFCDITGEPTDTIVNSCVKAYKDNECDSFIAIGGGSALDTMKAAAALAVMGGKIADYMGKQIDGKLPSMAAIPTTAGTGSEATKFTVITDVATGVKMLLSGPSLIPDIAIVDYDYCVSAPKSITAATGLDALTHAIESYTSKKAQPLTDTVALSAVKRIFKYLPAAYNDGNDVKAREEMSIAALEAGIAINNASVTIVHGMSRPIGANFHVPHGISNAMLLEKCLGFALDGAYERFAELARSIGAADKSDSDKSAAEALIMAINELCKECEIPTLAEYGIDKKKFYSVMDKMAEDAIASGSPSNTIKTVTKDDVIAIYKSLWE